MGWGRTLLLSEIGSRPSIEYTECDIKNLQEKIAKKSRPWTYWGRVKQLERENDQLQLHLASLLRLLVSKGTLSRDELEAFAETTRCKTK